MLLKCVKILQILQVFESINNKEIVYELVRISIAASKQIEIDSTQEFLYICNTTLKFFIRQNQNLLNKFPSDIEKEIISQLKDTNSYLYKNLVDDILKLNKKLKL